MTLFWHNHFATGYTKIAGIVGAAEARATWRRSRRRIRRSVRGQIEMLRDNALGNFRDLLVDIAKDTGDAVLARRLHEHAGAAAGELRPRDHGAVHAWASATTPSPTSTPRRACSPAGTWRGPAAPPTDRQRYQFVYIANQHDTGREDLQLSDLPGRQQDHSGAVGRRRACRTASTSSTRWRRNPETAALPGDEAVPLLRRPRSATSRRRFVDAHRRASTSAAATT